MRIAFQTLAIIPFFLIGILFSCQSSPKKNKESVPANLPDTFISILGIAQDAGYPQAGCQKACCAAYYNGKETKKLVTSLTLVDRLKKQYWLFEASPDMGEQLNRVQQYTDSSWPSLPAGVFITHAHIGHYSGLMQLGREVMGTKDVPVYVMPRMDSFIRNNGPWSQLVNLNNIQLRPLVEDSLQRIEQSFTISAIRVPHRDEFSETVGFIIQSEKKKVLFIPDIDKWEKWDRDIIQLIREVDIALIDGTFYQDGELPGRNMSEIPHPFVAESLQRFSSLPSEEKAKIIFIHFNHTNPLLKLKSAEKEQVKKTGMGVAEEGMIISL